MLLPWALCVILFVIVLIVAIQNYMIKINIAKICTELSEHLKTDTNTLISVSSGEKHILSLAEELNKQLCIIRKQRRKYHNGNRELKDAVTNISHDLRTPITAISGYLDLLENVKKSETAKRYIDIIRNRTEVLKELTEELFRYSFVTSLEYDNDIQPVAINGVLEESILGFYAALQERKITPNISMTENKVVRKVNRAALSRIFSNLINNAMKCNEV